MARGGVEIIGLSGLKMRIASSNGRVGPVRLSVIIQSEGADFIRFAAREVVSPRE